MRIDLGTDISSDWSFSNGDINLIRDYGNLSQAIMNRLNTDLDFYQIFYARYGGNLWEHMGDLNHPTIHEYIRIEVEDIILQDPRIAEVECSVTKISRKQVGCTVTVTLYDNTTTTTLNYVINANTGVSITNNTNELQE